MYLDKVEMCFTINQVDTSLELFCTIVFRDLRPGRARQRRADLHSLILYIPQWLINLGQCTLSYSKLLEDTFHLVKLVQIILHISYGVRHLASVLCHHTEDNVSLAASKSLFERYHF